MVVVGLVIVTIGACLSEGGAGVFELRVATVDVEEMTAVWSMICPGVVVPTSSVSVVVAPLK